MENTIVYTEAAQKIKKRWLIASLINFFAFPILALLLIGLSSNAARMAQEFAYTIKMLMVSLIAFGICYQCAYRKPGTLLLSLSLILAPIVILLGLYSVITKQSPPIGYLLGTSVNIWWYVTSLKLRKLNKSLQMTLVPANDPHLLAIQQAVNVNLLSIAYNEAIYNKPQYEKKFTHEYNIKKIDLSKADVNA